MEPCLLDSLPMSQVQLASHLLMRSSKTMPPCSDCFVRTCTRPRIGWKNTQIFDVQTESFKREPMCTFNFNLTSSCLYLYTKTSSSHPDFMARSRFFNDWVRLPISCSYHHILSSIPFSLCCNSNASWVLASLMFPTFLPSILVGFFDLSQLLC